jgi:hypothetical protein
VEQLIREETDQAALKKYAREQVLPKKIVEASFPFSERKKAADFLVKWEGLALLMEHYIKSVIFWVVTQHELVKY